MDVYKNLFGSHPKSFSWEILNAHRTWFREHCILQKRMSTTGENGAHQFNCGAHLEFSTLFLDIFYDWLSLGTKLTISNYLHQLRLMTLQLAYYSYSSWFIWFIDESWAWDGPCSHIGSKNLDRCTLYVVTHVSLHNM